jgi:hypothetical protein
VVSVFDFDHFSEGVLHHSIPGNAGITQAGLYFHGKYGPKSNFARSIDILIRIERHKTKN